MSEFWKKTLNSKNPVLNHVVPWKEHILHVSFFFEKHDFKLKILRRIRFWNKILQSVRLWLQNITKNELFCLKFLQCIRIWTTTPKFFKTLKWKIPKVWDFSRKFACKKSHFDPCYSVKTVKVPFFVLLRNTWFSIRGNSLRHVLSFFEKHVLKQKFLRCVRLWK